MRLRRNLFLYKDIDEFLEELDVEQRNFGSDLIFGITGMYANVIHGGHIDLIKNAKYSCDRLIIAVNNDECCVTKSGHCFMPYEHREKIIAALGSVSYVIENPYPSMTNILSLLPVEYYYKGGDITEKNLLQSEKDICLRRGISIKYNCGGQKTASSSQFLENYYQYRKSLE